MYGVPQGYILGPLLFNIFINYLLNIIKHTEICNFADDNTICSCGDSIKMIMNNLKADIHSVMDWFKANHLVANPDKFQMLILSRKKVYGSQTIVIDNITVSSKTSVKLLGITIDSDINFKTHVDNLCISAN